DRGDIGGRGVYKRILTGDGYGLSGAADGKVWSETGEIANCDGCALRLEGRETGSGDRDVIAARLQLQHAEETAVVSGGCHLGVGLHVLDDHRGIGDNGAG